jgi:hypothetical protein
MKMQSFVATIALAAVVSLPTAMSAATIKSSVHAFFGKPHKISLTLRNDSQQTLSLKAGDQTFTIEPGKTAAVKLMDGEKVITQAAAGTHAAGDVVVVAEAQINDATVGIK